MTVCLYHKKSQIPMRNKCPICEIEALRELAALVMNETGEDADGNMPHHPREALLILREAAQLALTPNAKVSGSGTASAGLPGYAGDNKGE